MERSSVQVDSGVRLLLSLTLSYPVCYSHGFMCMSYGMIDFSLPWQWPAVERLLGAGGRPLVVHPTAGEPFGPRLVFGLRGVAVEVRSNVGVSSFLQRGQAADHSRKSLGVCVEQVLESGVVASVALFQVAGKGS